MFFKIGVLRNFAIFKIPVFEYLFNKLQAGKPATLLRRNSNKGVFL